MLTLICVVIIQKRKMCSYVDYDHTTGEDGVIQNAASLTWPGRAYSVQRESNAYVKQRTWESLTYEDEDRDAASSSTTADPRIIRGQFYNNQFDANQAYRSNWMHSTASRYDDVEVSLSSIIDYILITYRTVITFVFISCIEPVATYLTLPVDRY